MRIKSKFKDYYDKILSEGQDSSLQFLRYPEEFTVNSHFPFYSFGTVELYGVRQNRLMSTKTHTIGFCGEIYSCLEIYKASYLTDSKEKRNNRRFCYSADDVLSFVKANFKEDQIKDFINKKYSKWHNLEGYEYFDKFFKRKYKADSWFDKYPVFIASKENYNNYKIVYNGCLKLFEFYKVKDSYSAFQELHMWLTNKAVPLKKVPEMSDEIKIEAHGYNKFSFRKEKKRKND